MSCEPNEIFDLAHSIVSAENPGEVQLRCAISRAYYSALHTVVDTFPKRENQYRVDGESSHAEIIGRVTAFAANPGPGRSDAIFIAKLMPRMRRTRNEADYRLDMDFEKRAAIETIEMARVVIDRCASVIDCQQRHALRSG